LIADVFKKVLIDPN